MTGTTVVLGWDGLDAQLVEEFGLADSFGEHVSPLETYANDVIDKPHTREVWPTIITGVGPDEHGIYAVTEDEGVKWSDPKIRMAARIGNYVVPEGLRTAIGRRLRSRGANVEWYDADYYDDQGLETVFDGRRALPIAVPNHRTQFDDDAGFMFDRGAVMSQWLDRDAEGWQPVDPDAQTTAENRMFAEAGSKIGLVEGALQRDHDLVFCWFGVVDTAGHVEPVAADPIQRRTYEFAAEQTERVRDALAPEDTLVCLSDHGLRDGEHTMDAVVASDTATIVDATDSVFDVKSTLEEHTPARPDDQTPPLRETVNRAGEAAAAGVVGDRLEGLGYVS